MLYDDKEKAIETLKTTEKYALKTNQKFGYNTFLNNKGIFFDINGFSDSAKIYFEKVESLKDILIETFLYDVILDRDHYLENGKVISRVWVELSDVSLNRKTDWETIFNFFYDKMDAFDYETL